MFPPFVNFFFSGRFLLSQPHILITPAHELARVSCLVSARTVKHGEGGESPGNRCPVSWFALHAHGEKKRKNSMRRDGIQLSRCLLACLRWWRGGGKKKSHCLLLWIMMPSLRAAFMRKCCTLAFIFSPLSLESSPLLLPGFITFITLTLT